MKENATEEKYIRMTQTPVHKLIIKLSIPTIVSMLITAVYNITDTYFVSQIGTSASGAVGVSFALMAIIQAVGFTLGIGSGNYIARLLGEKNYKKAERVVATAFFSALILGTLLSILVVLFIDKLVFFLGATETIAPYAKRYIQYIALGMPYMTASFVMNLQMRFQGSAFYSMIGIAIGSVINIILDPIFIFYLGWGISGAAIATIIGQLISFIILLYMVQKKPAVVRIKWKGFSPRWAIYKEILRGGLPSFYRQSLSSVSMIFLNQSAGIFGDPAVAAMAIVMRTMQLAYSVLLGLGQGFQPVCGFNFGAKRFDRVIESFWVCVKIAFVVTLTASLVGMVLSRQIITVFRREDIEVIRIGTLALRLQWMTYPLLTWIIIVNMLLQTIGKGIPASIVSISRQGMFFIPAVLILPKIMGVLGIQISQPISDICSFLLAVPIGRYVLKELEKLKNANNT
jgi:putative MATE family efflux protein